MRKAPGILGHRAMDYPVQAIMFDACMGYHKAATNFDLYNRVFDDHKDAAIMPRLFESRAEMVRQGTIAIVMAVTALDQIIYRYACFHLHHDDVDALFRNMGFVKKWLFIPEKAKNKIIKPDHPIIKRLEELVAARNAIIHQKVDWITSESIFKEDDMIEWSRFRHASSELKITYDLCVGLLR